MERVSFNPSFSRTHDEGPTLVGIDLGTSSVRTTAYERNGSVIASGDAHFDYQTTDAWRCALVDAAPSLPSGGLCSVNSTSGTVVLVDEYGNGVFPPLMYDQAAPDYAADVTPLPEAEELARRCVSLSATSPLPKILRLRDEYPRKFADVEWILSPATWVLYLLRYGTERRWTGLETDWTNALKLGADITRASPEWFAPLFEAVDLPLDLLPTIRAPGTEIGPANSSFARSLGLGDATLYQGMTDGNASALAAGCLTPGDYSVTCWDTSVVKYVSDSIEPHDALYYHRHPIDGYLPGAAFETGVIFQRLCSKLLDCSQQRGLELARSVEPGEEHLMFPQGNRSPFFDQSIGNTFLNVCPDQETPPSAVRGRFLRGITTGIALAEYTYLPLMEQLFDVGVEDVYLVNGYTTDGNDPFNWWNELRASIWDRELIHMDARTTVGCLIPAALTADVYDDADEASDHLLRSVGRINPDPAVSEQYAERRERFADRWDEIRSFYEDL